MKVSDSHGTTDGLGGDVLRPRPRKKRLVATKLLCNSEDNLSFLGEEKDLNPCHWTTCAQEQIEVFS